MGNAKMKNIQKERIAYVVSHTHWDREWRWPIWETRSMLIAFMEELIKVLESGSYAGFLLDGQVIPVLDYLEFRPEMSERIKSLILSGKLQIGPWYTLPDEYPVDGEALIRNLLWGRRKANELGSNFNVGYTSFGWGQTAQLAQIYDGFGIDFAMVGKRVSEERAPKSEFIWESPDGSRLLSTRLGKDGRANFYFNAHLSILFGIDHKKGDWKYDWSNGGIAYHRADHEQTEQDHFRLDAPTKWHPEMVTPSLLEALWNTTEDSVVKDIRLMMNGCDYTAAQLMLAEMLKKFNEVDAGSNRKWVQTTMPEFIELMKSKIDCSKLTIVKGELRDGPAGPLTGNALSTRLYLKQLNKLAQNMLIRFAEPMAAIASITGSDYPEKFIEKAWQFLLESQPHDSINGATQDKTANDVYNRLEQVIDISQTVGNAAMQQLISRIDMSNFDDKDVLITIFNSMPYERKEIIEAWINMPDTRPRNETWRAYRPPEGLQIFDAQGNPMNTQNQGFTSETYSVSQLHSRAFPYNCLRHKLFFDSGKIPAGGYKVFRANVIEENNKTKWSDSIAQTGTLLVAPNRLENEYLVVEMNSNGTFDLTDKKTGNRFSSLNYYHDRGESGDYWFNERPMFDQAHTSLGCSARIWAQESGPLQSTLVSEISMLLPKKCIKEQKRRSEQLEPLIIKTAVTLKAEKPYAEINVEFENRHEDHYLRAMFPTGLSDAEVADAGGHFIVDSRSIRPQGPTETSVWPDMATQPVNNFLDISEGKNGFAVLTDNLTEYEVMSDENRTIALSLLRAVGNWICTETRVGSGFPSQKGGQCLMLQKIHYALMPHKGNWIDADIPLYAELFNVPVRPVQTRKHSGCIEATQLSIFVIDNIALRFSTLKKAENNANLIARLYNPTAQTQKTNLKFAAEINNAWLIRLDETRQTQLEIVNANSIQISIKPYKIVTVEFDLKNKKDN